ncbi:MAG: hypothetical protein QOC93_2914 [Actinomycetota bacterium]|jgi:hypothetical protein|nr:hypothetical protein [Actinomycetota bacterium]
MSMVRAAFVAGLGIGYVLGARAGRERYEQIQRAYRAVRENPTVQETAGVVGAQASGLVSTAKGRVASSLSGTPVGERLSNLTANGAGAR